MSDLRPLRNHLKPRFAVPSVVFLLRGEAGLVDLLPPSSVTTVVPLWGELTKLGSDDEANTDRTASALLCETFLVLMAVVGLAAGSVATAPPAASAAGAVELAGAAAAGAAMELFCRLLLSFSSGGVIVVVGATAPGLLLELLLLLFWGSDDVFPACFLVLPLLSTFLIGSTASLDVVLLLLTTADSSLPLLAAAAAGFLSSNASGRTSAEGLKAWIGVSSTSSSSNDSPTLVIPVPFKAWTFETKLLFGLIKGWCAGLLLVVVVDGAPVLI
jgi:hypothetical protein